MSTRSHECPKMSTNPSSPIPHTLAEVIGQISARDDLPLRRRQELCSAVRVVCKLLGLPAAECDCDPQLLRPRLGQITASGSGLKPGRLRNVRSLFNSALTLTGVTSMRHCPGAPGLEAARFVRSSERSPP
jgi:hypothetical protein